MENTKVYILHKGEYSDQHVVGVFSSKEKMDKYIANHRHTQYEDHYWSENLSIDELDDDKKQEYHNYITKFYFSYTMSSGLSIKLVNHYDLDEETDVISHEINIPCECKIYNSSHGYIITAEKYSEEKLRKIIQDKIYQRICERNFKLEEIEIL